jgi:pimeloyl-ACP methyl ester carboxylesterase
MSPLLLPSPRQGQILDLHGENVHILESGAPDGRPVVVLHGCGSLAEEVILPFEMSDCRILAPDRPGYGFSSPLAPEERGPIGQSRWLERLLDALGLQNVTMVAHSIGSAAALQLAARRPDLLSGLLLISPCVRPVPLKPLFFLRAAVAPLLGRLLREHVIDRWPGYFYGRALAASAFPNEVPARLVGLVAEHVVNARVITTMADELWAFNHDMARLPSLDLDLRLHVVFGRQDRVIAPGWHIDWLRVKHPPAVIETIDGVGHMPHHAVPAIVLRSLHALLGNAQRVDTPNRAVKMRVDTRGSSAPALAARATAAALFQQPG